MSKIKLIEVFIGDRRIGRMAMTPEHLCGFEYDAEWIEKGFSISPFSLPLKQGLHIAGREPFQGGFGVFDDSLPDGWGALILDRYLLQRGIDVNRLTLLERLALVGSTGRGALEYRPDESLQLDNSFFDFDKLAVEVDRILKEKAVNDSVDLLYRNGGSSGGARPKVFATIENRHWLVKFPSSSDPDNIGEIEYNYALLAKDCGISMSEVRLLNGKYFASERFDRVENRKIHTVSVAGLLNADYRIPSLDYSSLLKLTLTLTRDIRQVEQMFRLMIFNIIISNRDDHAKNFSFQYTGTWRLSPAYDLLPSNGFNGFHTTTINGQGEPSLKDVLALAKEIGLSQSRANEIIEQVSDICHQCKMTKYILK